MEIFALDDDVARWDAALPSLHDTARLPVLLPLAWHLRQRNTRRAVLLADAALTQLGGAGALGGVAHADALRMMLVKAEARWLAGELDAAEQNVLALSEHFRALNDAAGSADSYYLLGSIAVDQGDHARSDSMFAAAAAAAVQAGDTKRAALADATSARWAVLRERDIPLRARTLIRPVARQFTTRGRAARRCDVRRPRGKRLPAQKLRHADEIEQGGQRDQHQQDGDVAAPPALLEHRAFVGRHAPSARRSIASAANSTNR